VRHDDARRLGVGIHSAEIACIEGMSTRVEDGIAKCRAGLTTIDEVFRVTVSLWANEMPVAPMKLAAAATIF